MGAVSHRQHLQVFQHHQEPAWWGLASSKEAKESSLKNIEDGMKFFNNQSAHILKLIKAQGGELKVQSAQIEAQSERIKIQSEQMKEMTLMLLRVVPLER